MAAKTRWSVARLAVGYHSRHIKGGHITVHDWLRRSADGYTLCRCTHHCLLPVQYAYLVAHRLAWLGGGRGANSYGASCAIAGLARHRSYNPHRPRHAHHRHYR